MTMRLTGGGHAVTILDEVSLEIPEKQMVAIVGPSGSGKSTLLGLIAGLDKPTSGAIWLDGVEITALPESHMARYRRQKIGLYFSVLPSHSHSDRDRECHGAVGAQWRQPRACSGRGAFDRRRGSRIDNRTIPSSFRVANSSASPWRVRLPAARRFCWPMNRPAISIPPPAGR